ncbi:unnamed protein product [Ixodes hexagonus]
MGARRATTNMEALHSRPNSETRKEQGHNCQLQTDITHFVRLQAHGTNATRQTQLETREVRRFPSGSNRVSSRIGHAGKPPLDIQRHHKEGTKGQDHPLTGCHRCKRGLRLCSALGSHSGGGTPWYTGQGT